MVDQVVTPALLRNRRIGRSRLQFIRRSATAQRSVQLHDLPTGRVTIATVETTILDIVEAPGHAAWLGNVGNVLGELSFSGLIDGARLAEAAAGYPATVAQRAGWLIEFMARELDTVADVDPLAELVAGNDFTALEPREPAEGHRDARWRLIVNTAVEHDL